MLINVRDFATVQDALNAAKSGDRVYFPSLAGSTPGFYQAPDGGWTINKSLEIFGDGLGDIGAGQATLIKPYIPAGTHTSNSHVFVIPSGAKSIHIHDLLIVGDSDPSTTGTGNGIHCVAAAGQTVSGLFLERLHFVYMYRGFNIDSTGGSNNFITFRECFSNSNRDCGYFLKSVAGGYMVGGYAAGNKLDGIYAEAAGGLRMVGVSTQNNQLSGTDATYHAQVRLKLCHGFNLYGCTLEDCVQSVSKTALTVESCFGGVVSGCEFINATSDTGTRGVFLIAASKSIFIGSNRYDRVQTPVRLNPNEGVSGNVVLPQNVRTPTSSPPNLNVIPDETVQSGASNSAGNFAVHHAVYPSSSSPMPNQYIFGLLLPRLATATINDTSGWPKQEGLLVYDGDAKVLKYWNGSAFKTVTAV